MNINKNLELLHVPGELDSVGNEVCELPGSELVINALSSVTVIVVKTPDRTPPSRAVTSTNCVRVMVVKSELG